MLYFKAHRKQIQLLIKIVREDFWGKYELSPENEKYIIDSYGLSVLKYNTFQAASMFSAGPLWLIKPILEMYILPTEDPSKPFERMLPFKNWVPFNLGKFVVYTITLG